jgi:hypothetical protein
MSERWKKVKEGASIPLVIYTYPPMSKVNEPACIEHSSPASKVYLDTSVLKFSATRLPRYFPREQPISWGGRVATITAYEDGFLNPNDAITNPELKREAERLPIIASLAKNGRLQCVIQFETQFEFWGVKKIDSVDGPFYGAPVQRIDAPFQYERMTFKAFESSKDLQLKFLASLKHERFLELQRMTGAYQGPGKLHANQLLDTFGLWCAEHNRCDFFLCLDFALQRVVSLSRKNPVCP